MWEKTKGKMLHDDVSAYAKAPKHATTQLTSSLWQLGMNAAPAGVWGGMTKQEMRSAGWQWFHHGGLSREQWEVTEDQEVSEQTGACK